MHPTRATVTDEDVLEAVVLLQRYSTELDQVAANALGRGPTGSVDLEILLAIARGGDTSPSALVQALGMPRSTLARGLARLRRGGLVERTCAEVDARRAVLTPSAAGAALLARFESALGDFLSDFAPVVKEVALLLGRDPEHPRALGRPLGAREVADRISAAGAAYRVDVRAACEAFGLGESVDRYAVVHLALRESRPSLIAEHINLTPAGTTSLLDRLEALGLVERRPGLLPADRRAVTVRLTRRGRRAAGAVLDAFRRHQDALLDALGATSQLAPRDPVPP